MVRALFVWGGWEGHQPRETTEFIAGRVRDAGLEPEVCDTLAVFDDSETLARFDVIVPCWTMGEISQDRVQTLEGAVRRGCGLAGWHGGMGDAFRLSTDYQFMVGGQFVAHPGNIIDYSVEITDLDHPITRDVARTMRVFAVHSEQYYMHVDPANHVLAVTEFDGEHTPWIAGVQMPVLWTRMHGTGRVAYCSIGHGMADLVCDPVPELVTRSILWAARAL